VPAVGFSAEVFDEACASSLVEGPQPARKRTTPNAVLRAKTRWKCMIFRPALTMPPESKNAFGKASLWMVVERGCHFLATTIGAGQWRVRPPVCGRIHIPP
jgi:hypothetical protein